MWFRLRPDIQYSDLAYGLWRCLVPGGRKKVVEDLGRLWAGPDHTFACLSVRTGFDLLLEALALPPGSEVVITALTIPDMVAIIRHHGLVPVPVDISPDTLGPDPKELERCLTPKTKAVVVTHLFGARVALEPILPLLAGKPIRLIEDCAQAFAGCRAYTGHPQAHAAMFSFGPIKTATALGGAMFRIKDPELLRRMKAIEARLPQSPRRKFFLRLWKYMLLRFATSRLVWGVIARACMKRGISYDAALTKVARGFGGNQDLITKIRHQPVTPLLALLRWRLARFDEHRLRRRQENGKRLAGLLSHELTSNRGGDGSSPPDPSSGSPACTFSLAATSASDMTYWLFPLLSRNREAIIARLREQGFDAAQHHTLGVVPLGAGSLGENRCAQSMLEELLFVPVGPAMPERELVRLSECLLQCPGRAELVRASQH